MHTPFKSYSYKLQLVKTRISSWVLFFALFGGMVSAIVLVVFVSNYYNISANVFILLLFMGGFLFLFMKYFDVLMIKYWSNISFFDTHFEVEGVNYNWNEVEWFATNWGGKFSIGLLIGMKGVRSRIRIFVASKNGQNLDECVKMMDAFKNIIDQKSIQTRNYYNTPKWRLLAHVLLLSNLIPLAMLIFSSVDNQIMIPIVFVWAFAMGLPTPLIIYFNQD